MEIDDNIFPIFISENKGQRELPKSCSPQIYKSGTDKETSDYDDDIKVVMAATEVQVEVQKSPVMPHGKDDIISQ